MALAEEINAAISFVKEIQAAGGNDNLENAATQLEYLASAIRGLANGDPTKINVTLTQWAGVNRLLVAKESAEAEITKSASPDWNKIGDGIAVVTGVAVKIAIAVAGAVA